jgi:hypothetical protein
MACIIYQEFNLACSRDLEVIRLDSTKRVVGMVSFECKKGDTLVVACSALLIANWTIGRYFDQEIIILMQVEQMI